MHRKMRSGKLKITMARAQNSAIADLSSKLTLLNPDYSDYEHCIVFRSFDACTIRRCDHYHFDVILSLRSFYH